MYIIDGQQKVVEYDLSIAWDVSTASYNGSAEEYSASPNTHSSQGLSFSSDGTRMYIVSQTKKAITEFDLSTPWDVSTATYNGLLEDFSVADEASTPRACSSGRTVCGCM